MEYDKDKQKRFRATIHSLFENRLKQVSHEKYVEIFEPLLIKSKAMRIKGLVDDTLMCSFKDTFDILLHAARLQKFWNSLVDKEDTVTNTVAWRPPGNANKHARSEDEN